MTSTDLLQDLIAVIGGAAVTMGADTDRYNVDHRKLYTGRNRCVVRPGSTSEVAAVVRVCAAHGVATVRHHGHLSLIHI